MSDKEKFRRTYHDLLAYGRHFKNCGKVTKDSPAVGCTCGFEIACRKAERVLGIPTYPKSYLPEGV